LNNHDCEWELLPQGRRISQADFLSIHTPLNPSARWLIEKRELRLMKKDSFLVNLSRGNIVDEEALYQVLKEGSEERHWTSFPRNRPGRILCLS
jgi:lactate dehydrogenase-like 2-hydroxyacid dehydrogenase